MENYFEEKRNSNQSENKTEKIIVNEEVTSPYLFNRDADDNVEGFRQDNDNEDEKITTTSATNRKITITDL